MDAVIIMISGNDNCPQPQTIEHLKAIDINGLTNIIVCHNKLDLITKDEAIEHKKSLDSFFQNTNINNIIPISAQYGININYLLDELIKIKPRYSLITDPLKMSIVRTFKNCKPGSTPYQLTGGILGGSIISGKIIKNQIIEIRPGNIYYNKGIWSFQPIYTSVQSLQSDNTQLDEAFPGGLIGIRTTLDPTLTMSDKLVGVL